MTRTKIECSDCGNLYNVNGLHVFEGKYYCCKCKKKLNGYKIGWKIPQNKDINDLLNKTYLISPNSKKNPKIGHTSFNRKLIGIKFKIMVEDEKLHKKI